ncbi:MAG: isoprenylcysteine carboxylmethyltransferase family protein [Lachnospiraceae bacterium]|jgi:protein-S-isoprenylcysteine O-methyltransferase Ste14|nr:isoprenylcysteine carboxylmethyltransferase family protein [Lachnospiraceae bacterium]
MITQIIILPLLCLFYIAYFAKALMLKKQGISVDLLGKGDKPKKAARVEIVLKAITWCGALIKFASAVYPQWAWSFTAMLPLQVAGVVLAASGVAFFLVAVVAMRGNWRAGFDKNQNTALVSTGIYRFSRNPAFVGFDLLYIGCALCFPNVAMLAIAVIAVVAFHIQILGEEKFLMEMFGDDYAGYKNKARRYL